MTCRGKPSSQQRVGKAIADSVYLHALSIAEAPPQLCEMFRAAYKIDSAAVNAANVYRFDTSKNAISAMLYPDFIERPFPELSHSWRIDLATGKVSFRDYSESVNPPILHRKELLLPIDHPQRAEFAKLTSQAESIGLFAESHLIGFKLSWEERIRQAGYVLENGQFQPLGNVGEDIALEHIDSGNGVIERHRTALSRSGLSAPMQALARHGLLDQKLSIFDYGCGRGDDISALNQHGIDAKGWDPHFASDNPKHSADIVNLGFVINVIEDMQERIEAVQGAFGLAKQVLVVSTMLYSVAPPDGRRYRDGYVTQRNTFQKYFTQAELKEFVEHVLDVEAIPVAPGIVFAFADPQAQQRFLYGKQRSRLGFQLLGYRRPPVMSSLASSRKSVRQELLAKHGGLVQELWDCQLDLGRRPEELEFAKAPECIQAFGSWNRALKFAESVNANQEYERAREKRRNDLLAFLALELFSRRKQYKDLDFRLRADIKAHFGNYKAAIDVARSLLIEVADTELLDTACAEASAKGLGFYEQGDFLQLHSELESRLPVILRVYIGCASVLFGDFENVDMIKVHIRSGKVTLLKYDDFEERAIPLLIERTKINLRTQEINFFDYGEEYEPRPLYLKSRYVAEDFPKYEEQMAFDEAIMNAGISVENGYGPPQSELVQALRDSRLEIIGHQIRPSKTVPSIDEACGRHFTYRDFIECSETWHAHAVGNVPKSPETYNSLHRLACDVLDPIIDYFGMIELTYGFSGKALTKLITGRIAPNLDQHASCELNRRGKAVCPRLGAAVDFLVEDEDMIEVANWIIENVEFDRLYVYGKNRPLHVSCGPGNNRQVTLMRKLPSRGNLVPSNIRGRLLRADDFNVA